MSVNNALLAVMFAILKEPPPSKSTYAEVNRDAAKDGHRHDPRSDEDPQGTNGTRCSFTGPRRITQASADIQAAALRKQ